jgi:uncharacterized protein YdhG (YjbR/CyaY superfamily)
MKESVMAEKFTSVDEYIGTFSGETRERLTAMRDLVRQVLPDAEEGISYNIPAYRLNSVWVVYFSGFAKHLSVALGGPLGEVAEVFAEELKPLKTSVAAIQFPHNKPLPTDLITRILEHRCAGLR